MTTLELLSNRAEAQAGKPPLLFLHGMWHGAWVWEPYFLPYFGKLGYRAYAMSLSTHAGSPRRKPLNALRIRDYVKDLREVVESLDESPVLVGHSMGGFILQKYLEQYEAPAAVLMAPVPPFGIWGGTFRVLKKFPLAFLKANLLLNLAHIINSLPRYRYILSSDNISVEDDRKNMQQAHSESMMAYIDMLGLDLVKTQKVNTPLLILGGKEDRAIAPAEIEKTAARYNQKPLLFEKMGHNLMLEPEYARVAHAIDAWLKELP